MSNNMRTKKISSPKPKSSTKAVSGSRAELSHLALPIEPEPATSLQRVADAVDAEAEIRGINCSQDDPMRLAQIYLRLKHHHPDRPTLAFFEDGFYTWDGQSWSAATAKLDDDLAQTMRSEFERQNVLEYAAYQLVRTSTTSRCRPPTVRKFNRHTIDSVKMALRQLVSVSKNCSPPFWLGAEQPFPACEAMAFQSQLVHIPSFAQGKRRSGIPATPRYFSTHIHRFDFDAASPQPTEWLKFLDEIFCGDRALINLLQEWFGYCLVQDTSMQKILMIVGPPRSGKGTIGRILKHVLGPESTVGMSFSSFSTNFGAAPLIGKSLALFADARLTGRSDQGLIIERLLSISGEDPITIDRKHESMWSGTLPTRIVLMSNELPAFRDNSNALASRLLLLPLKVSFEGREDPRLTDRLLQNPMGLLLWAIEGLKRLKDRGRFETPKSSQAMMKDLRNVSSPVSSFLSDCCELGEEFSETVDSVYQVYRSWCVKQGRRPDERSRFGIALRAVNCNLSVSRRKKEAGTNTKSSYYLGVKLKPQFIEPSY